MNSPWARQEWRVWRAGERLDARAELQGRVEREHHNTARDAARQAASAKKRVTTVGARLTRALLCAPERMSGSRVNRVRPGGTCGAGEIGAGISKKISQRMFLCVFRRISARWPHTLAFVVPLCYSRFRRDCPQSHGTALRNGELRACAGVSRWDVSRNPKRAALRVGVLERRVIRIAPGIAYATQHSHGITWITWPA